MTNLARVYTPRSRFAHLLPFDGASPALAVAIGTTALCGRVAWRWNGWLGTGSQHERETADALPTCARCERALHVAGQ